MKTTRIIAVFLIALPALAWFPTFSVAANDDVAIGQFTNEAVEIVNLSSTVNPKPLITVSAQPQSAAFTELEFSTFLY